jgi:hypothetical protein
MSPQEPTRHTYSGGGVVPKLNGINYFTWKMEVYNVAVLNGFADVLTGTKSRPRGSPVLEDADEVIDSDSAKPFGTRTADQSRAGLTQSQWESQNQKARALLLRSVDEMFHWQLIDMELASDAWAYLAEVHRSTQAAAAKPLRLELHELRLNEDGDMEAHLRRFGSLVERGRQVGMSDFSNDDKTCMYVIEQIATASAQAVHNQRLDIASSGRADICTIASSMPRGYV